MEYFFFAEKCQKNVNTTYIYTQHFGRDLPKIKKTSTKQEKKKRRHNFHNSTQHLFLYINLLPLPSIYLY